MSQETQHEAGVVQSLQQLGSNHAASCERSYNSDPNLYINLQELAEAWRAFHSESIQKSRRRAVMRTYATTEVLTQATGVLPIEASLPLGSEHLIWLGRNQHPHTSLERPVRTVGIKDERAVVNHLIDTTVVTTDAQALQLLWEQFGWTAEGVAMFVAESQNPIVVIRDLERRIVGAMIAEAQNFGGHLLVELTELAVSPQHRGQGLATVLIRELAKQTREVYGDTAVIFGEYNITTQAFIAATRAGQLPAQTEKIDGILHDHVAIKTGRGNRGIYPWDTEWLHNFLVLYDQAG